LLNQRAFLALLGGAWTGHAKGACESIRAALGEATKWPPDQSGFLAVLIRKRMGRRPPLVSFHRSERSLSFNAHLRRCGRNVRGGRGTVV